VLKFVGKTRDFHVHTAAESLVDFLNEPGPKLRPHQERAARAIELLRQLDALPAPERKRGSPRAQQLRQALEHTLQPLQHLRWRVLIDPKGHPYLDQTYHGDVDYGLLLVGRLSPFGLDWVRSCRCGRWFIAYSGRNRFHSPRCREAFWEDQRKTLEGREQHKVYMRRLRALKKQRQSKRKEKKQ
jgi:hypothetical protein